MAIPSPPPLPPFWGDAIRGGVTSILRHGGLAVAQGAPLGPAPLRQGASEVKQQMSRVPKEETFPFGCEEGLGGSTEEGKVPGCFPSRSVRLSQFPSAPSGIPHRALVVTTVEKPTFSFSRCEDTAGLRLFFVLPQYTQAVSFHRLLFKRYC